jgi:FKBP-type peptidyl-prolyl cis-trans isomerase
MGLSEALKLCPLGGSVRVELPASASFQRLPPNLKPESTIVWQVRLLEIVEIPAFSMPSADKLTKTASGLQYEVVKPGTGKRPSATDSVTVHYVGWLTNGSRFDTSYSTGQPASFALNGVIKGWTEGVQLMQEGGIYKFVIPANLAYGEQGAGSDIPPNSTLVFQIELISVP